MSKYVEILTDNEAVKSYDYPIEVKVYLGGTQAVPSSATITVKSPSGTKQVEDQVVSIAGSGTMTYTLDSAYTADLWENALIEIEYVISSITYKMVRLFDVVLNKLKSSVLDSHLKDYYPLLADEIWSGETNYDDQIQEAFLEVKRDIKDRGRRPAMIIDGEQIRELIIAKAFEIIFFSMIKEEGDKWFIRHEKEAQRYKDKITKLLIHYDVDESGTIEEEERRLSISQIQMKR